MLIRNRAPSDDVVHFFSGSLISLGILEKLVKEEREESRSSLMAWV